ncbi:MAG: hypothetical protein V1846_01125 [Candidatus Komeilibacteria bacterium]
MATINVSSKSEDWRGRRLSNFSQDPFELDGVWFLSVEGFIQGTKFPEGDERRIKAFGLAYIQAKHMAQGAERKFIWWQGRTIPYASAEHRQLIERAIRAKFRQNYDAMKALLSTDDATLTHDTGDPEPADTSLPAVLFCGILMAIRWEYYEYQERTKGAPGR